MRELLAPTVSRGEWWSRDASGRLRCELCPRFCTLREGQRGFCFVREARGGEIVLTSYGRASGFCIDPIEKKPLNHFLPGTSVLSFGTAGCNLGCRFCQNWDISKARKTDRLSDYATPDQIAAAAVDAGCRSIAFTYNDPVIFAEFAIDCAAAAKARGLFSVAVTAGYITEGAREAFFAPLDAVNIDLKSFSESFYKKLCFASLGPVLNTLAWVKQHTDTWLEVTTLLIPGENDSIDEIDQLVEWFGETLGNETPLHLTAFHPDYKLTDRKATPPETLARARERALEAGLKHVYTGNVHDRDGQSTYCAGCGALLIERNWYQLGAWHLDEAGRCRECGHLLAGRYEREPGTHGRQRHRVTLS